MLRTLIALAVAATLLSACEQQPTRTDAVRIEDDPAKPESAWGYEPRAIRVARGTTVTFTNSGTVFHTVTSDTSPRAFDAGARPSERVRITFDRAGTWEYHCGVHPAMKGIVHVCDGACT